MEKSNDPRYPAQGTGSSNSRNLSCLILTTEIAFEIWIIKPTSLINSNVELECIYRKKEDNIEQIDFLHIHSYIDNSDETVLH